ncbi:hypothetical protein GH733_005868 [Mirounga leonina]|nr:hypothetical protein GH733_005868 [Mirounga leonina]
MSSKLKASEALNLILITDVKLRRVTLKNPDSTMGKLPNTFSFDTIYDATSKQTDLYMLKP